MSVDISWIEEHERGDFAGAKCPECGCLLDLDDFGGYCVYCNDRFNPDEVRSL